MQHRHLNHQQFTLAAIDDVIARGKRRDWAELRTALLADPDVLEKVLRVCQAHISDPYAQRYHFWKQYAERHLPDWENDAVVQEADELREHYSFDYSKAKPNRLASRFSEEAIVVVLDPDVAAVFTTSEAANQALRSLIAA